MISKGIIIIPTQGFGNRLKMLASSIIFSNYYKIPLFVCWQPTPDCNIKLEDILVKENNINEISFDDVQKSSYCYFGQVHTNSIFDKISQVIEDPEHSYEYILLEGGHEYKSPDIPRLQYLQLKKQFYNGLIFTEPIVQRIQSFRQDSNLNIDSKYIAIHYRDVDQKPDQKPDQGDIPNDPIVDFVTNSPIESFFTIIDKISTEHPIVIISNTDRFYTQFKTKYTNKFNIYTSGITNSDRDNTNDMLDSVVDFLILSRAELIIGSYFSSFSDEASFFKIIPKITPLNGELIENIMSTVNNYHCLNYSFIDNIAAVNFNDKILIEYLHI